MNQQLELLDFLNKHQADLVFEPQMYSNQLTIAFADALIPDKLEGLFPVMRLHVARLGDEVMEAAEPKLEFITNKLHGDDVKYTNVWLTTSHIKERHLAMVEISFE